MVKSNFTEKKCSIARTLDIIGDWWSLLIVRDLLLARGTARFEDLREGLGISRNVLTERLRKLTANDVICKVPVQEGGRRLEYQLTGKGWELLPLVVAMAQWGDRWREDPENIALQIMDKQTLQPVVPVKVRSVDGRDLDVTDMYVKILRESEFLPGVVRMRMNEFTASG
jgi:DNA-binding HxlR family transcriptional regulator